MRYARLAAVVGVACAAGLSACTSTVDGAPTFAGDQPTGSASVPASGPTGGGIEVPSSGASNLPSPSDLPSASAPSSPSGSPSEPSGSPSGGSASGLCEVLSDGDLEDVFGGPATADEGDPTHCTYTSDDDPSVSVRIAVYETLTLEQQLNIFGGGNRTEFFGHAGIIAPQGYISVSIQGEYAAPGVITGFTDPSEQEIGAKLFELIQPHVA